MAKKFRYLAEASLVCILLAMFKCMPIHMASWLGGWMARKIGPLLSAHKTAYRNIKQSIPTMSEKEIKRTLTAMWDNLGRVPAELPHFASMSNAELTHFVEIEGVEHLKAATDDDKSCIVFSGHIGNWEITPRIIVKEGVPMSVVYRPANNPYVDNLINNLRVRNQCGVLPKGTSGLRKILVALKNGTSIGMLVDQKTNEGIEVPFFGRPAMTAPAIAEIMLKYNVPIVPMRIIRKKGPHYKICFYPALAIEVTDDHQQNVMAIMQQVNGSLEAWIREYPAQWFWVHNRWSR